MLDRRSFECARDPKPRRLRFDPDYTQPWYVGSRTLEMEVASAMQRPDCTLEEVAALLSPWRDYLERRRGPDGLVGGEEIEAAPQNLLTVGGELVGIDSELAVPQRIRPELVLARGLFVLFHNAALRRGALRRYPGWSFARLIVTTARALGYSSFGRAELRSLIEHEAWYIDELEGRGARRLYLGRVLFMRGIPLRSRPIGTQRSVARRLAPRVMPALSRRARRHWRALTRA